MRPNMIYEFHSIYKDHQSITISLAHLPPELQKAELLAWIKELKPAYINRIA